MSVSISLHRIHDIQCSNVLPKQNQIRNRINLILLRKDNETGRYHNVADPHVVTHPHRHHHSHLHHNPNHRLHNLENIIEYISATKEFRIDHQAALSKLMSSVKGRDQFNPLMDDGTKASGAEDILRKESVFLFWSLPKEFLGNHVITPIF